MDKFPTCPKCSNKMLLDTWVYAQNVGNLPTKMVYFGSDTIKIAVEDPMSNLKRLDFSISLIGGSVKVYNATKKGDLDKFHGLCFVIRYECTNCGYDGNMGLSMQERLQYDVSNFSFSSHEIISMFTYAMDDIIYTFENDRINNNSKLSVYMVNYGKINMLNNLPFIDIDIFDFTDKIKMKNKLDNILVLA